MSEEHPGRWPLNPLICNDLLMMRDEEPLTHGFESARDYIRQLEKEREEWKTEALEARSVIAQLQKIIATVREAMLKKMKGVQ